MSPEEAAKMLQGRVDALRSVPAEALEVLARETKAAASQVRGVAARARHSIDVRIVVRGGGVRVTIVGQQASRYRAMLEKELDRRVPNMKADIRTIAKGKSR